MSVPEITPIENSVPQGTGGHLGNEQGVVLIIVLVTILLLSLLGITLLDSTTSELKIVGNGKNNQAAFYDADAALTFAQTYSGIYTQLNSTNTVWPAPGAGHQLQADFSDGQATQSDYNQITLPSGDTALVKVELSSSGTLPAGFGTQEDSSISGGTSFKANYFVITAISSGPNNSSVVLESQIAKIVPQ